MAWSREPRLAPETNTHESSNKPGTAHIFATDGQDLACKIAHNLSPQIEITL